MTVLTNLARVSTATTGQGTITLGSAITGYLTFAQSGVTDGQTVAYGIRDGANSEVGYGVYTASGTTLTRNVTKSTNSNNPISLSGTAEVYVTARSEDIVNKTGDTMTGGLTCLNTGLKVQDTDASHTLSIVPGSNLTANRTLTWTTGDSDRSITLTGNTTIPATFPTSTTDKGIPRFSGTAGSFQTSALVVDDSGNLTGVNSIDIGNADTTITRASAGVIQVEGNNVLLSTNIGSTVQGYNANLADLTTSYGRATTAGPASLKLYEDTDNGSQYLELIAPNSIDTSNKQVLFQDVTGTVYVTNGQDVSIADGGTGASDAATARTNLGLGSIATQAANNVSITGGSITGITDLAVADGGTGASTLTLNNVILGNGTNAVQFVAPGTNGNVLTSNGTTWTSASPATPTSIPTGSVTSYAGSSAPSGWLLCGGQAVSRSTYSDLFAVISTTYGSGDGSTTFNLPDLRGRVAAGVDNMGGSSANRITTGGCGINGTTLGAAGGSETHTLTTAQLAAHTHTYLETDTATSSSSGGFVGRTKSSTNTGSSGSGNAHNNTQPTIMLNYIIKT